jgi:DNA replication protein DnaC
MAKSKMDETLKKIVDRTSKEKSKISSESDFSQSQYRLGDPNCPYCGGVGYLHSDVPLGHPNFGKVEVCSCQNSKILQKVKDRLYSVSHLDELEHLTFESFNPRGRKALSEAQVSSLEIAFETAQKYAQNLKGWVVFQGRTGCGKTHLAAAIANVSVNNKVPTLFLTAPDLLDDLRSTFGDDNVSFENKFDDIRKAQLLVLDDFGTQNASSWAQEKLFQIINYRYINKLSTVITTNLSADDMEDRIRSRLQDIDLVQNVYIDAPDYRNPDDNDSMLLSPRLRTCTFKNFSTRRDEKLEKEELESLQEALRVCKAYAEHPQGWIVITGDYGSGKTHLAAAIGLRCIEKGLSPLYTDVPGLLDFLRSTYSPNSMVSYDRRFNQIRTSSLLILDDFGTQSATPWAKEKIYQLFNYRYNMELPTVVTIAADALDETDPRIRSRMLDYRLCTVVSITAPPYHGTRTKKLKK